MSERAHEYHYESPKLTVKRGGHWCDMRDTRGRRFMGGCYEGFRAYFGINLAPGERQDLRLLFVRPGVRVRSAPLRRGEGVARHDIARTFRWQRFISGWRILCGQRSWLVDDECLRRIVGARMYEEMTFVEERVLRGELPPSHCRVRAFIVLGDARGRGR